VRIISSFAPTTPMGKPPPKTFPNVTISGQSPNNSQPPPLARRNPVRISSVIRSIPFDLHSFSNFFKKDPIPDCGFDP